MSTGNLWLPLVQEVTAAGLGCLPDTSGDPEPWLSYEAIAHLTRLKATTIENKAAGLPRHVLAPFIKLSDLEAKLRTDGEAAKKAEKKTPRRKRAPRRK